MIDAESLRWLCSPHGQEALAAVEEEGLREADFLPVLQRLSRRFPYELVRAAMHQFLLRQRAGSKFSDAQHLFFTREALEQATPEPIAVYRAARFQGCTRIFDLGCGIGGDALRLARQAPVVAIDRDRIRILLLQANARNLGLSQQMNVVQGDLLTPAWRIPGDAGVFVDPSRRVAGKRIHSVHAYHPPLRAILAGMPSQSALAVKVSPAVKLNELSDLDCEIEFISLNGELKEATLWFHELKRGSKRATILPGAYTLAAEEEPELDVAAPRRYLYEPDPAVMRAGLVRSLGAELGALQIDTTLSLLTADSLVITPFARPWRVLEVMPFNLKQLRAALRARGVGHVTLKKRGSAVEPEAFVQRLRLRGEQRATIMLTRVKGKHVVILIEQIHGDE